MVLLCALVWLATTGGAHGQQLRFTMGQRQTGTPGFATFRIGPLYSHFTFSEEVGVRYTDGTLGTVDFIEGMQRGEYKANGMDLPLITSVALRNYLPIGRHADLDITFWGRYEYYPLNTQDDIFLMNLTDPEFLADFSTSILWEFFPISYVRLKVHDRPGYLLDYVDQHGTEDAYGGLRYSRFENTGGADADILLRSDMNVALSLIRHDVVGASDAFANQDQTAYSGRAAYEYQWTPVFVAGVSADFQDADYQDALRGDYASQTYKASFDAELSDTSKASASLGYGTGTTAATNGTAGKTESSSVIGSFSFAGEISRDLVFQSSYSRALRPGFNYGSEIADTIRGVLQWKGESFSATLSSELASVDVAGIDGIGYGDWRTAISVSCPLTVNCTLGASSSYSVRDARPPSGLATAGLPSELVHDYTTWINRVHASCDLSRGFSLGAYVEHMNRDSANDSLEYERFNTGVRLKYVYEY